MIKNYSVHTSCIDIRIIQLHFHCVTNYRLRKLNSVACGEIIVWEERMTRYVDVIAAIAAIARRNASVTLQ